MHVAANSAVVWKRMANENQQSAKLLARVSLALAVLLLAASAYAFSAHSRFSDLCTAIETKAVAAKAQTAREFGESLVSGYCG